MVRRDFRMGYQYLGDDGRVRGEIPYYWKRRVAAKRRLYDQSKVPASGQAAPRFLQHDWLSRILAWNAHEKERYIRDTRAVPTSTEWKRHGEGGIFSYLRCRAYGHVRASHMHPIVIIEMHWLSREG